MDERRAELVAAGELTDEDHLLELLQGGLAVAVDGGLAHFRALKVVPDLLLGDLDSVSDDDRHWAEAGGCEVVELPSQESSDLAKAMAHMNHIGRTRVTIAAAAGGRWPDPCAGFRCLVRFVCRRRDARPRGRWEAFAKAAGAFHGGRKY